MDYNIQKGFWKSKEATKILLSKTLCPPLSVINNNTLISPRFALPFQFSDLYSKISHLDSEIIFLVSVLLHLPYLYSTLISRLGPFLRSAFPYHFKIDHLRYNLWLTPVTSCKLPLASCTACSCQSHRKLLHATSMQRQLSAEKDIRQCLIATDAHLGNFVVIKLWPWD